MTRKPRKGDLRSKNPKKFPWGARPPTHLEARRLGNRSVFILDPRHGSSIGGRGGGRVRVLNATAQTM